DAAGACRFALRAQKWPAWAQAATARDAAPRLRNLAHLPPRRTRACSEAGPFHYSACGNAPLSSTALLGTAGCGEDSSSNWEATMQTTQQTAASERYAKCVEVSKRIRWDIDRDVIRGRKFDFSKNFLPKGLSKIEQLPFLSAQERRMLSQVQGRTYANIFGLVERYIGAKILEIS